MGKAAAVKEGESISWKSGPYKMTIPAVLLPSELLTPADHLGHMGGGRGGGAEHWARPAVYAAALGKGNPAPGKNLLCHTIPRGCVLCRAATATAEKRIKVSSAISIHHMCVCSRQVFLSWRVAIQKWVTEVFEMGGGLVGSFLFSFLFFHI